MAPALERGFIYDSYACRVGKGTHKALDRLTMFLRKSGVRYVLNADIRKFFDSISHDVLIAALERSIRDRRLLLALRRVIDSYASSLDMPGLHNSHGVPIGNLTSQWFANVMGTLIDRFAKQTLRCRCYLRYMDNILFLSESKTLLWEYLSRLVEFLTDIGLVLNPKTTIAPTAQGVPFLGLLVFADHRRVLRPNIVRGKRRMRGALEALSAGRASIEAVGSRARSWLAHLEHADTYRLRTALVAEYEPYLGVMKCS